MAEITDDELAEVVFQLEVEAIMDDAPDGEYLDCRIAIPILRELVERVKNG